MTTPNPPPGPSRAARPAPNGPAPLAPVQQTAPPPVPMGRPHPPQPPGSHQHINGTHPHAHPPPNVKKKKPDTPVDPATMYESLKNRIAALEEEEVLEEEEERQFAEEAQKSVKGMEESAMHAKYIELFAEFKRLERDHAKEKQKLMKDKDAAKGQLAKANQTKNKMENLARELQKDNKKLREDGKRLAQNVEDAQDQLHQLRHENARHEDRAKLQDAKYRENPDIVVKVVCRYRAELFFKISRKTKLSRLFNAWTDRMEKTGGSKVEHTGNGLPGSKPMPSDTALRGPEMQFVFTHNGRPIDADQTPEDAGMEDSDEILAVELMDLTETTCLEDWDEFLEPHRQLLMKHWTKDPQEAKRTLEEMFDSVVRERLKELLKQYELRERHFECVIRSKELEVLLARARATEQKQVADGERARADRQEEEKNRVLRKEVEEAQNAQTLLIDKLIQCCKEIVHKPNAERTQRLFASLREELEKKRPRMSKRAAEGT